MEQILDAISEQSGIKIAYSTEELATNNSVSVDIKTSDIKEALSAVLGDGYTFKQIDDYIAIAKKAKEEIQSSLISLADERPWTVQGQVLENSEPPYPMAGVNISIKGTKLGTISAKKGYFHEAEGGTLFLDEVGNLAVETQQMLLRAIQERRYRPIGDNWFF